MYNFYPKYTDDGSVSLFNTDVNDIYHSSIGARKEAILKYIEPSGILEFAKTHNSVSILDICSGLGYNSKTAIDLIREINPECEINLKCLELDISVLALSTLVKPILKSQEFEFEFSEILTDSFIVSEQIESILKQKEFYEFFDPNKLKFTNNKLKSGGLFNLKRIFNAYFHNIYYRSISQSNNFILKSPKNSKNSNKLHIEFYVGDARWGINQINDKFDFIFHDGFTPTKNPCVWTIDFIQRLYDLLASNGNITTYSSSSAVRAAMLEVGLFVGETKNNIGKPSGTIASKNNNSIANPLCEKDTGLLKTNAGIVYRDRNFSRTDAHIIKIREIEQKLSGRESSSKYLKNQK